MYSGFYEDGLRATGGKPESCQHHARTHPRTRFLQCARNAPEAVEVPLQQQIQALPFRIGSVAWVQSGAGGGGGGDA